jgi:predicted amidohydrolase
MSNDLNVTLVQTKIHWQSPEENMLWFESRLEHLYGKTDLIILPEMFTTGFSMEPGKFAEKPEGKAMKWMQDVASKYKAAVVGTLMMEENGAFFNRAVWMLPGGNYFYYDKRHLFRMAGENNQYKSGERRLILDYKGWNICPLICYDLRFPVWSRNRVISGKYEYDLLIYMANWPEKRSFAWKSLLIARAIENQAYVAGINRIGNDGNNVIYSGDSAILDYVGEKISRTERFGDRVETVTLKKSALHDFREQFPAGMDADRFYIEN